MMEPITNIETNELRELVRNPQARREAGVFVIEGPHLVESALEEAAAQVQMLIVSPESNSVVLQEQASKLHIPIRTITQRGAERISDTKTTQGVFAMVEFPDPTRQIAQSIIALDGVQDPGNVGTIIRTASWFGVNKILASPGTADCYSPKVLRSSQGAIFNILFEPVADLVATLHKLGNQKFPIIGASISATSSPLSEFSSESKFVLVLGSEAHGISSLVEECCSKFLTIPKLGGGESLNVAVSCGIILAKLTGVLG